MIDRRNEVRRRWQQVVGGLVAALVLSGVLAVVFHTSPGDHPNNAASGLFREPLAPTALPSGFQLTSAERGNSASTAEGAELYATPDRSGRLGAPALLLYVGVSDGGPGTGTSLPDRWISRNGVYPGAPGYSVRGLAGAVQIVGWSMPDADLLRIASAVNPRADPRAPPMVPSGTLPPGLARVGQPTVGRINARSAPAGGYSEDYAAAGSAGAATMHIRLMAGGGDPSDAVLTRLYATASACPPREGCPADGAGRKVDIGNDQGWVLPHEADETRPPADQTHSVAWVHDGQYLRVDATGISEEETLAVVRSTAPIPADAPRLLRNMASDLSKRSPKAAFGPVRPGYLVVAEGNDQGGPWRVTVRPSRPTVGPAVCSETINGGGCTEGSDNLAPDGQNRTDLFGPDSGADGPPALFVGVVGPDITGVRVRLAPGRYVDGKLLDVRHGLTQRLYIVAAPQGTTFQQLEFTVQGGRTVGRVSRPVS